MKVTEKVAGEKLKMNFMRQLLQTNVAKGGVCPLVKGA